MTNSKGFDKLFAAGLILILAVFLAWALSPFLQGIFGALILFALFKPLHLWLTKKKGWNKSLSAFTIIVISVLIVLIPLSIFSSLLLSEINYLLDNQISPGEVIQRVDFILRELNIGGSTLGFISQAGDFIRDSLVAFIGGLANIAVNLVIMYFLLFYLLVDYDFLKEKAPSLIPFSRKNALKLFERFDEVTHAMVYSAGLVALIQAVLLGLGFLFFGIPGALLWSFVGFVFALLPMGIPVIWVPAGAIMLSQGNYFAGVGILVWGMIVSTVDNFLRPVIGKRAAHGHLHPLIILLGIFVGIPFFGVLGIIVGPLLIAYFFSLWKMFNEEYL